VGINDSNKVISKKINKAFSGGKETIEEHREKCANCDVDVSLNILKYFIDCAEYKDIHLKYGLGELAAGELKKKTIETLILVKDDFIKKRDNVTDDDIVNFMTLIK